MTPTTHARTSVVVAVLGASVAARLAPYVLLALGVPMDPGHTAYPWNFSPFLSLCLFGGAVYASRGLAYTVPLVTLVVADLGIWALTGRLDWAFYAHQPVVYLSVLLVATSGFLVRSRRSPARIAAAGLSSATAFFVATNFAVWLFGDGSVYPHTTTGLVECYVRALPYFRHSLVSMAIFLPLLFSRVGLESRPTLVQVALQRG